MIYMLVQLHLEDICRAAYDTVCGVRILEVCFKIAQAGSSEIFGDVLHLEVP